MQVRDIEKYIPIKLVNLKYYHWTQIIMLAQ